MQLKASRNQLNLPHGTETKTGNAKNGEQSESIVSVQEREDLWWDRFVKKIGFEPGVN